MPCTPEEIRNKLQASMVGKTRSTERLHVGNSESYRRSSVNFVATTRNRHAREFPDSAAKDRFLNFTCSPDGIERVTCRMTPESSPTTFYVHIDTRPRGTRFGLPNGIIPTGHSP
jgi:hypothetical protein